MELTTFVAPLSGSSFVPLRSLCSRASRTALPANRIAFRSKYVSRPQRRPRLVHMSSGETSGDLLSSPDFVQRIKGINEVRTRYTTTPEIVTALLPLISGSEDNPQVRYMAVSQLAGLPADEVGEDQGKGVLDACLAMLREDTDPSCQAGAADAIAALKLQDGFDVLVETFNSTSDWMLRFTIAAGVGVMSNPRSFEFLSAVLDAAQPEGDELLVTATIGALADLGQKEGLPIVQKYLDHPDASVKERAGIAEEILSKL